MSWQDEEIKRRETEKTETLLRYAEGNAMLRQFWQKPVAANDLISYAIRLEKVDYSSDPYIRRESLWERTKMNITGMCFEFRPGSEPESPRVHIYEREASSIYFKKDIGLYAALSKEAYGVSADIPISGDDIALMLPILSAWALFICHVSPGDWQTPA